MRAIGNRLIENEAHDVNKQSNSKQKEKVQ